MLTRKSLLLGLRLFYMCCRQFVSALMCRSCSNSLKSTNAHKVPTYFFAECCWVSHIHRSVFVLTDDPRNSCVNLKSPRNRVKGRVLLCCILWCQVRKLIKPMLLTVKSKLLTLRTENTLLSIFVQHLKCFIDRMCPKAFLV